ncbi:MAG TPA: MBL fold metallo-hydrolase [Longimicrobiaceae bacterium]|nr:MBL fold metallo-hydrolase [Longimicrobiaceae bacterium]
MATLHLLGTGAALSGPERTTTMLAFENRGSVIVADCGGDVVQRLLAAGLDPSRITALILTHEHPDHAGGFPLFMEKIWLSGRRHPIPVCGPAAALGQARRSFESFRTGGWEGVPEIDWREVPLDRGAGVWMDEQWRIRAAPGRHSVPVIGVRAEAVGGGAAVYSSDTECSGAITELARGADVLAHEATGGFSGHSTAADAAAVAAEAGVGRLVLVHLPPEPDPDDLAAARGRFPRLELGRDGDSLSF